MDIRLESVIVQDHDLVSSELDDYTMLMSIEAGKFFSGHCLQFRIRLIEHHRLRFADVALEVSICSELRDDLAELAVCFGGPLILLAIRYGFRVGE